MGPGPKGEGTRSLPAQVVTAIRRYLTHRGTQAGPLFQTRGERGKRRDGRLETRSLLRIVRERPWLGFQCGAETARRGHYLLGFGSDSLGAIDGLRREFGQIAEGDTERVQQRAEPSVAIGVRIAVVCVTHRLGRI